jgi:hypothetical protein
MRAGVGCRGLAPGMFSRPWKQSAAEEWMHRDGVRMTRRKRDFLHCSHAQRDKAHRVAYVADDRSGRCHTQKCSELPRASFLSTKTAALGHDTS